MSWLGRVVSFLFYASLLMAAASAGAKLQRHASFAVGCMAASTAIGAGIYHLCAKAVPVGRRPMAELHQPLVDEALDAADDEGRLMDGATSYDGAKTISV